MVEGYASYDFLLARLVGRRVKRLIEPLTRREMETLKLVCDGLSNEEIASITGITHATVKWHLINIFGKLGVKRRTQAVAAAVYLDLVRPSWLVGDAV